MEYYIPKIEELFVGYEYEEYRQYGLLIDDGEEKPEYWKPNKIAKDYLYSDNEGNSDIQDLLWLVGKSRVRTKYLTKEDIESLGWEEKEYEHVKPKKYFKKGQYVLTQLPENKITIGIYQSEMVKPYTLYQGSCPSKNELKYLSKLLNIE